MANSFRMGCFWENINRKSAKFLLRFVPFETEVTDEKVLTKDVVFPAPEDKFHVILKDEKNVEKNNFYVEPDRTRKILNFFIDGQVIIIQASPGLDYNIKVELGKYVGEVTYQAQQGDDEKKIRDELVNELNELGSGAIAVRDVGDDQISINSSKPEGAEVILSSQTAKTYLKIKGGTPPELGTIGRTGEEVLRFLNSNVNQKSIKSILLGHMVKFMGELEYFKSRWAGKDKAKHKKTDEEGMAQFIEFLVDHIYDNFRGSYTDYDYDISRASLDPNHLNGSFVQAIVEKLHDYFGEELFPLSKAKMRQLSDQHKSDISSFFQELLVRIHDADDRSSVRDQLIAGISNGLIVRVDGGGFWPLAELLGLQCDVDATAHRKSRDLTHRCDFHKITAEVDWIQGGVPTVPIRAFDPYNYLGDIFNNGLTELTPDYGSPADEYKNEIQLPEAYFVEDGWFSVTKSGEVGKVENADEQYVFHPECGDGTVSIYIENSDPEALIGNGKTIRHSSYRIVAVSERMEPLIKDINEENINYQTLLDTRSQDLIKSRDTNLYHELQQDIIVMDLGKEDSWLPPASPLPNSGDQMVRVDRIDFSRGMFCHKRSDVNGDGLALVNPTKQELFERNGTGLETIQNKYTVLGEGYYFWIVGKTSGGKWSKFEKVKHREHPKLYPPYLDDPEKDNYFKILSAQSPNAPKIEHFNKSFLGNYKLEIKIKNESLVNERGRSEDIQFNGVTIAKLPTHFEAHKITEVCILLFRRAPKVEFIEPDGKNTVRHTKFNPDLEYFEKTIWYKKLLEDHWRFVSHIHKTNVTGSTVSLQGTFKNIAPGYEYQTIVIGKREEKFCYQVGKTENKPEYFPVVGSENNEGENKSPRRINGSLLARPLVINAEGKERIRFEYTVPAYSEILYAPAVKSPIAPILKKMEKL